MIVIRRKYVFEEEYKSTKSLKWYPICSVALAPLTSWSYWLQDIASYLFLCIFAIYVRQFQLIAVNIFRSLCEFVEDCVYLELPSS